MTDRTAPSSDARKRNAERVGDARGESFNDFIAHVYRWAAPSWRPVTYSTRTHTIDPETGHFTPIQEDPMTAKDRHDELVALLTEIRDRLPAPADDLPGEPVEPGDLRAGDVVAFTYDGERIQGPLARYLSWLSVEMTDHSPISVLSLSGRWAGGISDVRLIERAPREDEGPDEALARVIFGDAYGSHEGLRLAQLDVALMAREHIEAEQEDAVAFLREEVESLTARAEKAEGVCAILEDRVKFWQEEKRLDNDAELSYLARAKKAEDERGAQAARATKAEAERDALRDKAADLRERLRVTELDGSREIVSLRERLDVLRAGLSRLHSNVEKWHTRLERDNADGLIREALRDLRDLARDDERGAR